jgi:hypothetical protein
MHPFQIQNDRIFFLNKPSLERESKKNKPMTYDLFFRKNTVYVNQMCKKITKNEFIPILGNY